MKPNVDRDITYHTNNDIDIAMFFKDQLTFFGIIEIPVAEHVLTSSGCVSSSVARLQQGIQYLHAVRVFEMLCGLGCASSGETYASILTMPGVNAQLP